MSAVVNIKDYKINLSTRKGTVKSSQGSFLDFILKNDFLFMAIAFFDMIMVAVIIAGLYDRQPTEDRSEIAFTQFNLILLSLGFVYVIVTFMNEKIDLFGKTFDMGMILYVAIVMFIMFILGG